jgi:hypothetical protein
MGYNFKEVKMHTKRNSTELPNTAKLRLFQLKTYKIKASLTTLKAKISKKFNINHYSCRDSHCR